MAKFFHIIDFPMFAEDKNSGCLIVKMGYVIDWIKQKNKDVIIIIENPLTTHEKGYSIMDEALHGLCVDQTVVQYCYFSGIDQKPTHLWTNVGFHIYIVTMIPTALLHSINSFGSGSGPSNVIKPIVHFLNPVTKRFAKTRIFISTLVMLVPFELSLPK
jgi:hypothetical protein